MKVYNFILSVAWPFKYYVFGSTILVFFQAFSSSYKPYLTKLIINTVENYQGLEAVSAITNTAILYIILHITIFIGSRIHEWCELKYIPLLKNHIAYKMTEYTIHHSFHFFQNNFTGSIVNKITDATSCIPKLISVFLNYFSNSFLTLLVAIYALYSIHFSFAIIISTWAIVFTTLSFLAVKNFVAFSKTSSAASSKVVGFIVDLFGNINSVRLFANHDRELVALRSVQKKYEYAVQQKRSFALKFDCLTELLNIVYHASCLILLIYFYSKSKVTIGDFAMLLTINSNITTQLCNMSNEIKSFSENVGTVHQAMKVLETHHEIQDHPSAIDFNVTKGEIIFDRVNFHYKGAEPLFKDLSVKIAAGEKVGLVGYSGSGKTSFVNLILRIFESTNGKITIDNQDISTVTQSSLRKAISMIPQETLLFHRSLLENIKYGKQDATFEEVIQAAQSAAAHDFISKMPEGYDALVGERGIKLSGGQRQRIAIARAVLCDTPILILDEATSQLDSITEDLIQNSIKNLMVKKTTIIIAHRLSTLLAVDRILVFNNGEIIQDGSHLSLLEQPGLYKTLWNTQIGGFLPEKHI